VEVAYRGVMDTTAETFARCRVEVRDFMRCYENWPRGQRLFADLTSSGCPLISVHEPYMFSSVPAVCALH